MTPRLLAVATQGAGGDDEQRLRGLLEGWDVQYFPFDRSAKWRSFRELLRAIRAMRPELVILEGTGWAGGLAVILSKWAHGAPYVVSSGDAVGPFVRSIAGPIAGWAFERYERALYRHAVGFIGWTPYLVGRALTFGAPRGMTAAGWAPFSRTADELAAARVAVRARWSIPNEALVIGLVGSLAWNGRKHYAYGLELVEAAHRARRPDLWFMIVGDGDGRPRLEQRAAETASSHVVFTGRVPRDQVPDHLAAFDLASLPQSADRVGSFRYTTKLSEYLAARLPVVTGPVPLAYDLNDGWAWRLNAPFPWTTAYADALAALLDGLQPEDLAAHRRAVPEHRPEFDRHAQHARVTAFLSDLQVARRR